MTEEQIVTILCKWQNLDLNIEEDYNSLGQAIEGILYLYFKEKGELKEIIPTNLYACDPNKHKECKKNHCYINGGECDATTDETKVKYIKLEDYIPKDKIREKIEYCNRCLKNSEENLKTAPEVDEHNIRLRDVIKEEIQFYKHNIKLYKELLEEEENEKN